MTASRPLPTVIGPTENALRALLGKILSTTRIGTYPAWVVLNAATSAAATASSANWRPAVADALKVNVGDVDGILAQLRAAGLVDLEDAPTDLGTIELTAGRAAVSAATARLVDGIGEEEQAIARLVLDHVRSRAEELLRH